MIPAAQWTWGILSVSPRFLVSIVRTNRGKGIVGDGIVGTNRGKDAARTVGKERSDGTAEVVLVHVADAKEQHVPSLADVPV